MASRLFLRIIFKREYCVPGIFHCLTFANFYNKHYFFHSRAKLFGKVIIFVMLEKEKLHIYICLQQSTFKKGQIYAKLYLYIYIFRIKDTVWAYFLKNDIYTTLYFSL